MKPAGQMSVTLTPALERLVRAEVESGTFASNSEVLRDALRERYRKLTLRELDEALERGIADIEAGRSMPAGRAFAHIRKQVGLKRKTKKATKRR
jgi:antitoxin ParD1/3/4